jgi:hypothetical protein
MSFLTWQRRWLSFRSCSPYSSLYRCCCKPSSPQGDQHANSHLPEADPATIAINHSLSRGHQINVQSLCNKLTGLERLGRETSARVKISSQLAAHSIGISQSKEHQQTYESSAVLDLQFLCEIAVNTAGTSNSPRE